MSINFFTAPFCTLFFSFSALSFLAPSCLAYAKHSSLHSATHASKPRAHKNSFKKKAITPTPVQGEFANFSQWQEINQFIDNLVTRHNFDKNELIALFNQVHYVDTAVQLVKPAPPGRPKNWQAYRARFIEPLRINAGVVFWNTYANALQRAEMQYGVPQEIIVGILGVETIYGRNTGNFRVIDALTTLAFAYPDTPSRTARMSYFRTELENLLLLARDTKQDPLTLLGSYAGAIGLPQFMPSSIRQFGVDFDADGKIDLRNSATDAIGSIANFLAQHGWKRDEPIVFPISLTPALINQQQMEWEPLINQGLKPTFLLSDLRKAGISAGVEASATLPTNPPPNLLLGVIDLQNGLEPTEYWLATGNFFAITHYNRSYFYAMSVVDLSHAVRTVREAQSN